MILYLNINDKISREFLHENYQHFSKIYTRTEGMYTPLDLAKYPAVEVTLPGYYRDNSVWFRVQCQQAYKQLGTPFHIFEQWVMADGCTEGSRWFWEYTAQHPYAPDTPLYLIDVCNFLNVPSAFLRWCVDHMTVLPENCPNELRVELKQQNYYEDFELPLLQYIPETTTLAYPDSMEDILLMLQQHEKKARDASVIS